ncbi:endo-1,4-beta-xylanase [Asanoa sp. NPDC049518]|uniref:endo-1,4-beta-xylanase n=1 Tax=unclassified Asanoa TaxID=2685164 RepID=UPI0034272868
MIKPARGARPARTAVIAAVVALAVPLVVAPIVAAPPAAADAALRVHAAARGKFVGYAASTSPLANEAAYRSIAASEFNQVTAENAMKWESTEPSDGNYTFSGADQVVAFAAANNQQVHGHTLVWHSQTPGWVQGLSASAMRTAMQDHIATVVGRYANNAALVSWDVVNEVFEENGSLRTSFWYNTLGSSYIADAFRYARAADSNARLCINDYNVEGINAKSTAMYNLVRQLRADGVPVDCVGFQGHLAIQYGFPSQFRENLERFAALGVQVRITELDVRMQMPRDSTKDATQATYYRNVVQGCLAVTACAGVTIWGFTDKYSWVPDVFSGEGAALPWDANYSTKPAYTAIHDALDDGSDPDPDPDTTPPTTPGTPVASGVTSSGLSLSWTASSDAVGVTGYDVLRATGASGGSFAVVGTPSSASFVDSGLAASTTYRYQVRARDAAGNVSSLSPVATVTTTAGGGGPGPSSCRVAYTISPWGGTNGFTAGLVLTNTGTSSLSGWSLAFTLPSGQTITPPGWSATWSQSGQAVTATPLSWNSTLAPGGSTTIGFNGTHTGGTGEPTTFTVGSSSCTVV